MMRLLLLVCFISTAFAAAPWPLERLFTRPFAWGTTPERVKWSKHGHTLAFLWNAEGRAFRDLYSYDPETRALRRLTRLESESDPLTRSAAEKDVRRKNYLLPDEGLTDFDLASDGSRAAFAYRGDLYLVRTEGSAPPFRLTRTKAAESAPQLSPDGTKIAFIRDSQLFTQDLTTGQLWQATDIEGEGGASLAYYHWSPDGKRFLYTVRAAPGRRVLLPNYSGRLVTAQPLPRTLAGDPAPDTKLYVITADGRDLREMEPGPWGSKGYGSEGPEWSPDSNYILSRVVNPDLKQAQILTIDLVTRKATVAFEDRDAAWVELPFMAWSPDSRQVLFTSERDGWSHLYRVKRDGGEAQQITHGTWEIHTEHTWARDPQWIGDYIYYSSTEVSTAERQLYRIHPDGSGKERLTQKEGMNVGIESEDGRYTALLFADLSHPWDLFVNGERVTTSPRAEFGEYPWPETRFVTFPSPKDHKTVAAKILMPPGSAARRPAILFIHGSGYATSVLKQWGAYHDLRYAFNCYLANKGYVVMDMDYRGSSGYGRDWRTGVYLHMGGPDLEDVLGAVEYLRGLGNVDMQRVGIWGSSYGGFMTNMAMFVSPDTFRAGAAFSAVNDWENYNAFYTEQRLAKPQENPEAYRRSSPITFAGLLKNHLLMVHGIVDSNVMFQDAVQLTEKLLHEGKDFEEAYYPEEDHLFARDESLIDAFRKASGFFDRWLQ
jgi:dipeptidyl aminopeptidase/acylaminoacyl peptidase